MADPKGFLSTERQLPQRRPVDIRIRDWKEVYQEQVFGELQKQAGRCMDCGIPFCHQGCPLGNLIPEWNDLIWRGEKEEAVERLHATNNFLEHCDLFFLLGIDFILSFKFFRHSRTIQANCNIDFRDWRF